MLDELKTYLLPKYNEAAQKIMGTILKYINVIMTILRAFIVNKLHICSMHNSRQ